MRYGPSITALIDGDIVAYQCAAAAQKTVAWDDDVWTNHAELSDTQARVRLWMDRVTDGLDATRVVVALSDPERNNFRYDVLPTYKGNRKSGQPPLLRKEMEAFLASEYESYTRPGLEGDDVLGILSTSPHIIKGEKVVVSLDKDMLTLPGQSLNVQKAYDTWQDDYDTGWMRGFVWTQTPADADMFHLRQALAGDTTDGYGGCPGIGMDTAAKILADEPHVVVEETYVTTRGKNKGIEQTKWVKTYGEFSEWETIVSYYAKAGLDEEHALQQARVARICRHTDYDFDNKEVILWAPDASTPAP